MLSLGFLQGDKGVPFMLGWGEPCKCEVDKIIYEMENTNPAKKKGAPVLKLLVLWIISILLLVSSCYSYLDAAPCPVNKKKKNTRVFYLDYYGMEWTVSLNEGGKYRAVRKGSITYVGRWWVEYRDMDDVICIEEQEEFIKSGVFFRYDMMRVGNRLHLKK